jgi:ATP-dependent Clp protease adaptor protein ClpS
LTTQPLEKLEQKSKLYDPYKVLLHNDNHNDMDHVVQAICKSVPQVGEAQAVEIMNEAHHAGLALVIACPLEHAEMYQDRLQSFGLTCTIEKGD